MSSPRAIERGSDLLGAPTPEEIVERCPDQLATQDAKLFVDGRDLLEERR